MTDAEFYSTLDSLREHAKVRRQESLTAADVDQFKLWDDMFGGMDMILLQHDTDKRLNNLKELRGQKTQAPD